MSLFNEVAEKLSNRGLITGTTSIIGDVSDAATQALGGGKLAKSLVQGVSGVASNYASSLVNRFVSPTMQKGVVLGAGMAQDLMQGGLEGAALRAWQSGILADIFPGAKGILSQMRYWGTETPLFGGISPMDARKIYEQCRAETYSKKNLWLLEVTSNLGGGSFNMSERFNLFATDVEYAPFNVVGDKVKIGSSTVDLVESSEPVELRITTMDDDLGTIKRWYLTHANACTARDGTVAEPGKYAIRFKIVHSFINTDNRSDWYETIGYFRPSGMDLSLSRREDNVEEIQMTFTQLDTFIRP